MTFWMGLIVGAGFGAFLCNIFYMFVIKWALRRDKDSQRIFEKIQSTNGDYIKRIAVAIEKSAKDDSARLEHNES